MFDDGYPRVGVCPTSSFSKRPLEFGDEPRPPLGHRRAELEPGLLIGRLDDERVPVRGHVLHRREGYLQPKISTKDEDFPLELGFADRRLSPDPDRALCLESHRMRMVNRRRRRGCIFGGVTCVLESEPDGIDRRGPQARPARP